MRTTLVASACSALASALACLACGTSAGIPGEPAAVAGADASTPSPAVPVEAGAPVPRETDAGPDAGGGACAGRVKMAGDFTWMLTVAGESRTVNVHVPLAYDPARPTPAVLNIHGYTDSAEGQASLSRMVAKSDAAGFVVAHPQGIGNSWNAGACCGASQSSKRDDVAFVAALLDELAGKLCIDERRMFVAGFSNGGFFAHRLACELSGRIAAVASVAGLMTLDACAPSRPVPVLQFHGTGDAVVPYGGSTFLGFPSAATVVSGWAERNGCTGAPAEIFRQGDARCESHAACAAGATVTFCTVEGGGHTWPGGVPMPTFGKTSTAISATDVAWDFFAAHPRP